MNIQFATRAEFAIINCFSLLAAIDRVLCIHRHLAIRSRKVLFWSLMMWANDDRFSVNFHTEMMPWEWLIGCQIIVISWKRRWERVDPLRPRLLSAIMQETILFEFSIAINREECWTDCENSRHSAPSPEFTVEAHKNCLKSSWRDEKFFQACLTSIYWNISRAARASRHFSDDNGAFAITHFKPCFASKDCAW